MYNSVASEWQNTNLGVSVTPILTGDATGSYPLLYTFTVSNHATYDDPAYFVEVYDGTTLTIATSAVTDNLDGTLTFAAPTTGTYEIRVICQDFGDLQSEMATKEITTTQFGGDYRYFKLAEFTDTTHASWIMLGDFRMYTGADATGTTYPPDMTSAVLPTPYVVTSSFYFSTYPDYRAFDQFLATNFWWTLATPNTPLTEWIKIDFGSSRSIVSVKIQQASNVGYLFGGCTLYGSTDDTNWDNLGTLSVTKTASATTIIG
jgi:hypothetical protein